MKFQAQASSMSKEEVAGLLAAHDSLEHAHDSLKNSHDSLKHSHDDLARQVAWLKRQLFGRKSERRICDADGR